jgi:hydroxymethylbilane synthase
MTIDRLIGHWSLVIGHSELVISMHPLRIGTRGSQLALWQANHVADRLRAVVAPQAIEIVIVETHGDVVQDRPLATLGGFGAFTKSIQDALLDHRVDVAVHSLKDLPTIPVPGLELTATPPRGPVGDAFVAIKHARFADLPEGAIVGTSSIRRKAQLLSRRRDLQVVDLRGNVETRVRKLREQNLDAIVLAEAGLLRLGLATEITEILDPKWMLPAVGQGAIGLECRAEDSETRHMVEAVNDRATWAAIRAERAMLWSLGGGCLVPIGALTTVESHLLTLRGVVLSSDGSRKIVDTHCGPTEQPLNVGAELAARLCNETEH